MYDMNVEYGLVIYIYVLSFNPRRLIVPTAEVNLDPYSVRKIMSVGLGKGPPDRAEFGPIH